MDTSNENGDLTVEQLKAIFPERILLARLDDIFAAWKVANDARPAEDRQVSMAYPAMGTQAVIIYEYEQFEYRSTVTKIDPRNIPQVEIKLSNDGIINPPRDTNNSKATHQKRIGWCRLSDETIKAHFPAILAGCKAIMRTAEGELIQGKVLYHEIQDRVDFFFERNDKSASVLITFEPGDPEHFHNNDEWGKF